MDYHKERHSDRSLIVYANDVPSMLLVASSDANDENHLIGHGGLTFGGFVQRDSLRQIATIEAIQAVMTHLGRAGVTRLSVKSTPALFKKVQGSETDYGLWKSGFRVVKRAVSSAIQLDAESQISSSKLRYFKAAQRHGLKVEFVSVDRFYPMLVEVLQSRHGLSPVHSAAELNALHERFPREIRVRCAVHQNEVLAGTVLFQFGDVWHTQYLACSDAGKGLHALDFLLVDSIREASLSGARLFSFGSSMDGTEINEGLLRQKESFGGRTILLDTLEADLC